MGADGPVAAQSVSRAFDIGRSRNRPETGCRAASTRPTGSARLLIVLLLRLYPQVSLGQSTSVGISTRLRGCGGRTPPLRKITTTVPRRRRCQDGSGNSIPASASAGSAQAEPAFTLRRQIVTAAAAFEQLDSWIEQNPPGHGIAWRGAFGQGVRRDLDRRRPSGSVAARGAHGRALPAHRFASSPTARGDAGGIDPASAPPATTSIGAKWLGLAAVAITLPELTAAGTYKWEQPWPCGPCPHEAAMNQILPDGSGRRTGCGLPDVHRRAPPSSHRGPARTQRDESGFRSRLRTQSRQELLRSWPPLWAMMIRIRDAW
mgnify:CR=1 FL=1